MTFEEAREVVYKLYKKPWKVIQAYGLENIEEALYVMHSQSAEGSRDKEVSSWLSLKLTFEEG